MQRIADLGIAALWQDERPFVRPPDQAQLTWLRELWDNLVDVEDLDERAAEILDTPQAPRVRVLTPKNDLKELPAGATALDFAYSVATGLGHRTVGAKVNGRLVPLDHMLRTNDSVEIITTTTGRGPSPEWLSIAQTPGARQRIRQGLRRANQAEHIRHGQELLGVELRRFAGRSRKSTETDHIVEAGRLWGYTTVEALYAGIGYGAVSVRDVLAKMALIHDDHDSQLPTIALGQPSELGHPHRLRGTANLMLCFATCCAPEPDEPVAGFINDERGLTVHAQSCRDLRALPRSRVVPLDWGSTYPVTVLISGRDRTALVQDITTIVSGHAISIDALDAKRLEDGRATVQITMAISSAAQLVRVVNQLERVRGVLDVQRVAAHPALATREQVVHET